MTRRQLKWTFEGTMSATLIKDPVLAASARRWMTCMATGSSGWCCSAPERAAIRTSESDYDVAVFLHDMDGSGRRNGPVG